MQLNTFLITVIVFVVIEFLSARCRIYKFKKDSRTNGHAHCTADS